MIETNSYQCYSKQWKDYIDSNFFIGYPYAYLCMSRQDVSEEVLKNKIAIISSNSKDEEDIYEIEAKFEFNSTAITCLTNESWAHELVHNSYPISSDYFWIPCVTSTGLLANFYYYKPIDGEFVFLNGCIFFKFLIPLMISADFTCNLFVDSQVILKKLNE